MKTTQTTAIRSWGWPYKTWAAHIFISECWHYTIEIMDTRGYQGSNEMVLRDYATMMMTTTMMIRNVTKLVKIPFKICGMQMRIEAFIL